MKRFFFIGLGLFAMSLGPTQAQTATDVNEGVRLTAGATSGAQVLSWWGRSGRTYFVQQSFDLITWSYLPALSSGADTPDGLNFTSTGSRQFWRLRYTDAGTGSLSAADADFDGDGLSNYDEVYVYHTDPFNWDTDGDGFPDGEEVAQNTNPLSATSVPNQGLAAAGDNPAKNELPVYLFEQTRLVANDYYKGTAAPASNIAWFDYAGNSGDDPYTGGASLWSGQLQSLVYPPISRNPNNWFSANSWREAFSKLSEAKTGDNFTGYAHISYSKVGLVCDPVAGTTLVQPWDVYRKYFTYSSTAPRPNKTAAVPTYFNLDMQPLVIRSQATMTADDRCFVMEPPNTMANDILIELGDVWASPYFSPLALDVTGQDHDPSVVDAREQVLWLTLPSDGTGVPLQLHMNAAFPDQIVFQAQGGGVSPAVSTWNGYGDDQFESYTSSTVGTGGALYPAVDDGKGNLTVSPTPLLQFDVKESKQLYITIIPIGLADDTGTVIITPKGLPAEADIQAYLEGVFGPQANVHPHVDVWTQVNVNYDVGLGDDYGSFGQGPAWDKKLSMVQGQLLDATKVLYSAEEGAIMKAPGAEPDPTADITLYWVGCNGINVYTWVTPQKEILFADPSEPTASKPSPEWPVPVLGTAGKGMDAYRIDKDTRRRIIWIAGLSETTYQTKMDTPSHSIAHEVAHVLGNLMHTIEEYGQKPSQPANWPLDNPPVTGYSPYSDNCLRLMTGISNSKRLSGPTQLSKLERDKINVFKYKNP